MLRYIKQEWGYDMGKKDNDGICPIVDKYIILCPFCGEKFMISFMQNAIVKESCRESEVMGEKEVEMRRRLYEEYENHLLNEHKIRRGYGI